MNATLEVIIRQFDTETLERLTELLNMLHDQHKDVSFRPEADVCKKLFFLHSAIQVHYNSNPIGSGGYL